MLPFQGLQSVMSKLRFKDETALRGLGLAKLVRTYDAYPVQEGSRRLFCLLPRGMPPSTAQKFGKEAAAKQIIVLEKAGESLSKIWPVGDSGSDHGKDKDSQPASKVGSTVPTQVSAQEDVLKFVDE
jgi:hypothetical protein